MGETQRRRRRKLLEAAAQANDIVYEAEPHDRRRKKREIREEDREEANAIAEEAPHEHVAHHRRRKAWNNQADDLLRHKKSKTPAQEPVPEEKTIGNNPEPVEIKVTGTNVQSAELQPWWKFQDVRTSGPGGYLPIDAIKHMEHDKGFKRPTSIQSYCWPIACAKRDLIGIAETGSGKTLAFLLPVFPRIRYPRRRFGEGPRLVVICPTRELAVQIEKEAAAFQLCCGVTTVSVYGGASKGQQINALFRGADIVVGCPGRMNDLLTCEDRFSGKMALSLANCTALVLDEADRMLEMGFEQDIRRIVDKIPNERQTMLFTATWPKEVRSLANDFLNDPVHVKVGAGDSFQGNKDVEQRIIALKVPSCEDASYSDKKEELLKILRAHEKELCLVFCSMKRTTAQLSSALCFEEITATCIHGDLEQPARDAALEQFRSGEKRILVATDVAARGLDVKGIGVVVNYDPANNQADHVHRIGRTGRAGAKGVAYTLLGDGDVRQAQEIVQIFHSAGQQVPENLRNLANKESGHQKGARNRYQSLGASPWMLSELQQHAKRFESFVPGLFALAFTMLALIGLRKFCRLHTKLVLGLQEPLMST